MKLPNMPRLMQKNERQIIAMRGINYGDNFTDGDMADSTNLSARRYPYISTRRAREKQEDYSNCTTLGSYHELVAVRGTDLLYNGEVLKENCVTEGEKQFAAVNTKLVIFPDKVYVDFSDIEHPAIKPLDASVTGKFCITPDKNKIVFGKQVGEWSQVRVAFRKGTSSQDSHLRFVGYAVTTNTLSVDKDYFLAYYSEGTVSNLGVVFRVKNIVRDGENSTVYVYGDPFTETEENNEGRYIFCEYDDSEDMTDYFHKGDGITISNCQIEANNTTVIVSDVDDKFITITTTSLEACGETNDLTIERKIPDLDYICESENRLWGCSTKDQTIYASALGDPTNFKVFEGLSTDSYAVAVGSEHPFTGCHKYQSSILFWKENRLHKILGSYPAEYTLYTYEIEGVENGSHKSMQIINEILIYKGLHGVCSYTGSSPSLISGNVFGNRKFTDAVAGTDGERYYISMKEGEENHLFVFDTKSGLWLREDDTRCVDFARIGKDLYFLEDSGDVYLADNGQEDGEIMWHLTFTPFYETIEGKKSYSRIFLRAEIPQKSYLVAEVRLDQGAWREIGRIAGQAVGVSTMRIPIGRCDKFELRLKGKGACTILSLLREFSVGSEV